MAKFLLSQLVFLYRDVLHTPLDNSIAPIRAKRKIHPPTVLSVDEVGVLLSHIRGTHLLMAKLIYGSGMRLMECIRLRVQDVDFANNNTVL